MLNENLKRLFANPRGSAEVMVEKLPQPPVIKEDSTIPYFSMKHQTSFQENMFDNRRRERIGVNEGQRPYTHETFDQVRHSPPKQYNSARHRHGSVYTEAQGNVGLPVKKADGVDRAFPLKPVYHKRTLTLKTQDSLVPYEFEQLCVSSRSRGHSEYTGETGKNCHKKPMEIPPLSSEVLSNSRDVMGSQRQRRDRHMFPDEQQRRAREIHEKELLLQEKLLRTEEKLRMIQRERATSDGNKRSEEEGSYGRRRRAEQEKERTEIRVPPAEQQRREVVRCKERVRQERSIEREKTQEDIEWQKERQEERSKVRIRNIHEEEWNRWDRRDSRTAKKPQLNRDKRAERVTQLERGENGESDRWERDNVKGKEWNRGNGRNEKVNKLAGDKGETSQWEREKGRGREQHGKMPEEDIDWQRGKKWERQYEEIVSKERYRYVSSEHKKEQEMSYKGQKTSTRGPVRETHDGRGERVPGEPSVSTLSHSSRLQQVEPRSAHSADKYLQSLPCKICHRNFAAERLERHLQICQKLQQSCRKVFDASSHRAKGTDLEKFPRSKTPERYRIKRTNWREKHEVFVRNLRQTHAPDGTLQPDSSLQDNPDYVSCPHCSRRFAPGPAERHIPKCQDIKSRPPPPRHRQQK